jgi:hypothetical protein
MRTDKIQLAWELFVELRKELVESQKMRAQMIGFKITFVTSAVAIAAANIEKVPPSLLVIPAFAAVFFDFLISSYSFSIKRTGYYVRTHIEPILAGSSSWPTETPLWEQFMANPSNRQNLSFWGNMGTTLLASVIGFASFYIPSVFMLSFFWNTVIAVMLCVFLAFDIWCFYQPSTFFNDRTVKSSTSSSTVAST